MCGIAGILVPPDNKSEENLQVPLNTMTDVLAHRGPDDSGTWVDAPAGIAMGHRRLSVIDLSVEGSQPMASADGRHVIVYNGEIYNYMDLRRELGDPVEGGWRGHSDTEVLLEAISRWGLMETLGKVNGMFAFALWDRRTRTLSLVRDRIGEKPLYFGEMGGCFLFASELKSLRAHPAFRGEVDRGALALLLRYGYVPSPYSIYQGIEKLEPGTVLTVSVGSRSDVVRREKKTFWSVKDASRAHGRGGLASDPGALTKALHDLLLDSVEMRMVSDVPLGAFLSGGIDSSTVVALMQARSDRPVKTFSIGFHEAEYNEAQYARQVAGHLGTEHTELYLTAEQTMEVIPGLPVLYDEPFADPSQIPTYLVSALAREHVTVALSGDGGDELFAGYNRYLWARQVMAAFGPIPAFVRVPITGFVRLFPAAFWNSVFRGLASLPPGRNIPPLAGDKMLKVMDVVAPLRGKLLPGDVYRNIVSHWQDSSRVVRGAREQDTLLDDDSWPMWTDLTSHMTWMDMVTYLPDDILVKVDRASMAVSLEARVPVLDHRVIEFALGLPLSMKLRDGVGKWLLRQVLYQYVPPELVERPKMGFGIPIDRWLRGPLRGWAEELLDEGRLRREGYFDPAPIRKRWAEHLSGKRNWQQSLWNVLMFQAWKEHE